MSASGLTKMCETPVVTRRVRAYFAPVDRVMGSPTIFDPAVSGCFDLEDPPEPWTDLGWIENFSRASESQVKPLTSGSPATVQMQLRELGSSTVSFSFSTWNKLTMALSAGSQHMNLLAPAAGSPAYGSGGKAAAAAELAAGSTTAFLAMSAADCATFAATQIVAVDSDYCGQTGYVGNKIGAAYVRNASDVGNDPDYLRRITFNLGRVSGVTSTGLTLADPLPAGAPGSEMKVQRVLGFVDREGGRFFHEWSALFVMPGEQGERILFHYPRLQSTKSAQEATVPIASPLSRELLDACFRALPIIDGNDGEQVLCYRSFLPAAMVQP